MSKQVDRHNYLKYAGAGVIAVGAAGAGYYYLSPKTIPT